MPAVGWIRPSIIRSDVAVTGAVGPQVAVHIAPVDGQIDVVDRDPRAVLLAQGKRLDGRRAHEASAAARTVWAPWHQAGVDVGAAGPLDAQHGAQRSDQLTARIAGHGNRRQGRPERRSAAGGLVPAVDGGQAARHRLGAAATGGQPGQRLAGRDHLRRPGVDPEHVAAHVAHPHVVQLDGEHRP